MKQYCTDQDVKNHVHAIIRAMVADDWRPDFVVGLSRGGLVPATMISHYLDIPMRTLMVSLRDGGECVSDLALGEDAYGYVDYDSQDPDVPVEDRRTSDPESRKKILIVDDINDSGATLNWIKQDWMSGCLPDNPNWEDIWNNTVRFAVLINNESSDFKNIDYSGTVINRLENQDWIVFPWENWWEN
jgi:uncharacterized protein